MFKKKRVYHVAWVTTGKSGHQEITKTVGIFQSLKFSVDDRDFVQKLVAKNLGISDTVVVITFFGSMKK